MLRNFGRNVWSLFVILFPLYLLMGFCTAGRAQVVNPPVADTTALTQAQQDAAQAKQDAATAKQEADAAMAAMATIPKPATTPPPGVSDNSAAGTMTTLYALANHTHASKARKGRVLVPAAGFLDVTFSTPFSTSPPICAVTAETASGDTNVVNAQIDGTPTMTGMRVRITRTAVTAVSLIGLSVLSVPVQVATQAHYVCLEP